MQVPAAGGQLWAVLNGTDLAGAGAGSLGCTWRGETPDGPLSVWELLLGEEPVQPPARPALPKPQAPGRREAARDTSCLPPEVWCLHDFCLSPLPRGPREVPGWLLTPCRVPAAPQTCP